MVVSTHPEARRRLAELMEERRLDLGLYWQDVVDAAITAGFKLSLKTLHSVRTGTAGIRPLTQRAIEAGLQWEYGSIQRIEDGGDPVDAMPVAASPVSAAVPEPPRETLDPGDDVTGAVVAALFGQKERRIWAHVRRRLQDTPAGTDLFADPAQAAAWPPESVAGTSGGAPFDLTPEARQVLNATPGTDLFTASAEIVVWNLDKVPFRKRVEMIREYREPVRGAVRRAGLRKPDALSA